MVRLRRRRQGAGATLRVERRHTGRCVLLLRPAPSQAHHMHGMPAHRTGLTLAAPHVAVAVAVCYSTWAARPLLTRLRRLPVLPPPSPPPSPAQKKKIALAQSSTRYVASGRRKILVMAPVFDLSNHERKCVHTIGPYERSDFFHMIAGKDVKPGDEICYRSASRAGRHGGWDGHGGRGER